ncbi:CMRF35-like molecule 9 isoform X3 [Marmota marmota marmota]|uniref:CMRF35-like molecule 9 isoform X3 n=1 Tax=Marmota marmota marmota TaxID=9994 RepID=UPI002093C8AD|nr:CMRF35-like molecule 9 isoform X3 [Marmota marmota marmota]
MRPVVLLWSCLMLPGYEALKGPKDISGFEGDTVSLKCTYGKEERERKKYWCKQIGFLVSRCSSTIYSGEDGQEITQGRVSICDNPQELAFTVTLRDLTLQDAGKYWCGADKLGFDETFLVSLTVFPAPPDLHLAVTTAKQGKTGTEASPVTGTVPWQHAGTSTHTGTSPHAGTSAHTATSPHAGSSRPPMPLDSTLAEDTSPVPISHSSRSRVSIPMVRILAPVLVLLSLLLAAGLIASGSLLLRWRKKAQLALETQKNEKVHLPTLQRKGGSERVRTCLQLSSLKETEQENYLRTLGWLQSSALLAPSMLKYKGLEERSQVHGPRLVSQTAEKDPPLVPQCGMATDKMSPVPFVTQ